MLALYQQLQVGRDTAYYTQVGHRLEIADGGFGATCEGDGQHFLNDLLEVHALL